MKETFTKRNEFKMIKRIALVECDALMEELVDIADEDGALTLDDIDSVIEDLYFSAEDDGDGNIVL